MKPVIRVGDRVQCITTDFENRGEVPVIQLYQPFIVVEIVFGTHLRFQEVEPATYYREDLFQLYDEMDNFKYQVRSAEL